MVRENLRTEFIVLTDLILFEKQFVNILTFFLFLTFGKSGEGDKTAHLAPSLPPLAGNGREDIRAHPNIFRNNTPCLRKWHP